MYFLLKQLRDNFRDRSIIMLDTTSEIVRYGLKAAMMTGHPEDLKEVINALSKKEGVYKIRILDKSGIIKYSSKVDEINKNISLFDPHHADFEISETKVISLGSDNEKYSSLEPIKNEKMCQSCHEEKGTIAYLDIDTNLTLAESAFYTGFEHMIYLGWAVIIILSIGLYIIFNKFINSPLKKLVLALNDVEKGYLNVKLKGEYNDEIGIVFQHFNSMTSNLKSSREKIDHMHMAELQRLGRLTTLGELTSQTAHEINNHIAIIMSRTDYLSLESVKVQELQKYDEDIKVLQDQISKISYITGNLLKYSRKQKSEKKRINLAHTIKDSVALYSILLEKRKIKLNVNINIKDASIVADAVQISQVLANLINNAADAIGRKGNIVINLSNDTDNNLVLTVQDDGPGIKKDIVDEIFSPFFTTKNSKTNTGLGLYIVKKICDNHNANIECISETGNNTKFRITFKD
ncbi:ATP-binding protein, partial [Bacteroidota bacterium]